MKMNGSSSSFRTVLPFHILIVFHRRASILRLSLPPSHFLFQHPTRGKERSAADTPALRTTLRAMSQSKPPPPYVPRPEQSIPIHTSHRRLLPPALPPSLFLLVALDPLAVAAVVAVAAAGVDAAVGILSFCPCPLLLSSSSFKPSFPASFTLFPDKKQECISATGLPKHGLKEEEGEEEEGE